MNADPIRALIADHSPTTGFAGPLPLAPKPIDTASLAPLHADNPPSDVDPPLPNAAPALVRCKNARSKAPPAAQPTAKSP